MNYRAMVLGGAIVCASMASATADAANHAFKTRRCATVELTQQESPESGWDIYTFVETGELRPGASFPANLPVPSFSRMNYVCKGYLAKDTIALTTGTILARSAAALCVFTTDADDRVLARAASAGMGTQGNPPRPPVNFKIVEGTGRFARISGKGVGNGFLPVSEQSGGAETCSTIHWTISLPR